MSNRSIKDSVIRKLYACSGNLCAFPDCNQELFESDDVNYSNIAHIEGLNPGSARYNPKSTDEDRNCIDNLILLCQKHHKKVDKQPVKKYTVEFLKRMKAEHENWVKNNLNTSNQAAFYKKLQTIFQECNIDEILLTQSFDAPFPEWYIFSLEEGYMRIRDLLNDSCSLCIPQAIKRELYGFTQLSEYLLSCVSIGYIPNGTGIAVQVKSCSNDDLDVIRANCNQVKEIYMKYRYGE